jgi:hypothetical protein
VHQDGTVGKYGYVSGNASVHFVFVICSIDQCIIQPETQPALGTKSKMSLHTELKSVPLHDRVTRRPNLASWQSLTSAQQIFFSFVRTHMPQ